MTPGRARVVFTILAAALFGATGLAACGDDDGGDDHALPAVQDIAPAVTALEAKLGGPQHYFELDATALGVTLWVAGTAAGDDAATTATPYLYVGDEVASNGAAEPAQGQTFTAAEALTFDADRVLDGVAGDLADSTIDSFSIVGSADSGVQFAVVVVSDRGGEISVQVDGQGRVLAADVPRPSTPATTA